MAETPLVSMPLEPVTKPKRRRRWVWWLVWTTFGGLAIVVLILLQPSPRSARGAARLSVCQHNLKQLAYAMRRYVEKHGRLPPARTFAADGTPLHSWRTLILPDLGEKQLFESIDLTKPWDDPVNARARKTPMPAYMCAEHGRALGLRTTYQVVISDAGVFRPDGSASAAELAAADGHTCLVVDAPKDQAVHWMEPRDLDEATFLGLPEPFDGHPFLKGGSMLGVNISGWIEYIIDSIEGDVDIRRSFVTTANDEPLSKMY